MIEGLRKNHKKNFRIAQSPGQDLNLGPPEYEEVLTTQPWRLVSPHTNWKKLLLLPCCSEPTLEADLRCVTLYLTICNCGGVPGVVLARCWGVHCPSFAHCVHWVCPAQQKYKIITMSAINKVPCYSVPLYSTNIHIQVFIPWIWRQQVPSNHRWLQGITT